jgi:hypothetical protein
VAVQQPHAELVLQRANVAAQRRLGDADPLGGLAHVAGLGDGDEVTQLAKIHGSGADRRRSRFEITVMPTRHWFQAGRNGTLGRRSDRNRRMP